MHPFHLELIYIFDLEGGLQVYLHLFHPEQKYLFNLEGATGILAPLPPRTKIYI